MSGQFLPHEIGFSLRELDLPVAALLEGPVLSGQRQGDPKQLFNREYQTRIYMCIHSPTWRLLDKEDLVRCTIHALFKTVYLLHSIYDILSETHYLKLCIRYTVAKQFIQYPITKTVPHIYAKYKNEDLIHSI